MGLFGRKNASSYQTFSHAVRRTKSNGASPWARKAFKHSASKAKRDYRRGRIK